MKTTKHVYTPRRDSKRTRASKRATVARKQERQWRETMSGKAVR